MADFARRAGDKVELVAIDGCGRGLRALVDIAEGETIISEPPLYAVHPEALSTPAFMRRPDVARLFAVVEAGYDDENYTPDADAALQAVLDLHAKDGVASLGTGDASRFWALDDCFRRPAAGDAVEIAGLVSARGRPLNGLRGRVDCADGERWAVATAHLSPSAQSTRPRRPLSGRPRADTRPAISTASPAAGRRKQSSSAQNRDASPVPSEATPSFACRSRTACRAASASGV